MPDSIKSEILSVFKKYYDFLEKMAGCSSNCHNYLNEHSLAAFPIFRDDIIYASTCYVYNGDRRYDDYDIGEGKYNPNHYIRTLITTTGVYQFNSASNERTFILWNEFNIYEFQFEYLVGNANNTFDKQWKQIFREIIEIVFTKR